MGDGGGDAPDFSSSARSSAEVGVRNPDQRSLNSTSLPQRSLLDSRNKNEPLSTFPTNPTSSKNTAFI